MLPVSTEYPIVPISQYDPYQPPFVPQIQVHPLVQHLFPMVCSKVATLASVRAQLNPARMFCYNFLASAYWNNSEFTTITKLAADMLALGCTKGLYRTPEMGMDQSIDQALTIYVSVLLFKYPELQQICSPDIVQSAGQNASVYNNLQVEIDNLYRMQPQAQSFPQQMPSQQGQHFNVGYQAPQQNFQPQQGMQSFGIQQPNTRIPGFYGSDANIGPRLGNSQGPSLADIQSDRFANRSGKGPVIARQDHVGVSTRLSVNPEPIRPTYQAEEQKVEPPRSKHIRYFDIEFPIDNVIKLTNTVAEVKKSVDSIPIPDEEKSSSDDNVSVSFPSVYRKLLISDSLSELITSGRIYYLDHINQTGQSDFYRVFGLLNNAFFTNVDLSYLVESIKNNQSFADISLLLKQESERIINGRISNLKSPEKAKSDWAGSETLRFILHLDSLVTGIINDFLNYRLDSTVRIDSFVSDVASLFPYLSEKGKRTDCDLLFAMETAVIKDIFKNMVNGFEKETSGYELPDNIFTINFPILTSVTYLSAFDVKELNVHFDKKTANISRDENPMFWEINESLTKHRIIYPAGVYKDYVMLENNKLYQVVENLKDNKGFTIIDN